MSPVDPDEAYQILRHLSSPLVALTCRRGKEVNGMVSNSAVRASLVPGRQRVANYVFKGRYTHDFLAGTGRYVLHLLARDQWEEIWSLGFRSGREVENKLEGLPYFLTEEWELPVLERCYAWMRCRVVNVMDAGSSTFFMGQVEEAGRGTGREVMDSDYFRANMPEDWRQPYEENLRAVQEAAAGWEGEMDDRAWRKLRASASS